MSERADARRRLPQVDRLAQSLAGEVQELPRTVVVDAVRAVVAAARRRARRTKEVPSEEELLAMCRDELFRRERRMLRPVINATGVVLHTNLGRAPLSERAIDAVTSIARGYSNLEWDADRGQRGDRYAHVEPLLALAAGAEAALVVNNNAAAVLLVCAALAQGRQVVVSRGELIEIGGEFRIPEILASSGATLREVGTTNRTHLRDYERAITDETAIVLKVHPSNYRVVGFTAAPSIADIVGVAHARDVPVVFDVGSGLVGRAFADEPVVTDAIDQGCDLVCFSGDKLFGGPQAGIITGRAELIAKLRTYPMLRAMRPDKMQLAALGATAAQYLEGTSDRLPVWQMLDAPAEEVASRANDLAAAASAAGYETRVGPGRSVAGGGSLPGEDIDTTVVRLRKAGSTAARLGAALRFSDPPVVARVEDGWVVLDLRTVPSSDDAAVANALASLR